MFFLLRVAFWLGLVLILLPTGSAHHGAPGDVHASEAISAASATVKDLRGFCSRQPGACAVGTQVATAIGYKAQAGAKLLYEVLTDALAPHSTGALGNGAARRAGAAPREQGTSTLGRASQNTLTPADLAPAWHEPRPRKNGKRSEAKRSV